MKNIFKKINRKYLLWVLPILFLVIALGYPLFYTINLENKLSGLENDLNIDPENSIQGRLISSIENDPVSFYIRFYRELFSENSSIDFLKSRISYYQEIKKYRNSIEGETGRETATSTVRNFIKSLEDNNLEEAVNFLELGSHDKSSVLEKWKNLRSENGWDSAINQINNFSYEYGDPSSGYVSFKIVDDTSGDLLGRFITEKGFRSGLWNITNF